MANTWTKTPDGSLRCTACGTTFAPGDHCQCPAGGPAKPPTQKLRNSSEELAGPPADNPTRKRRPARTRKPADGFTVRECAAGIRAVVEAARRHRKAIDAAPTEDEQVDSEDGARRFWRQAWLAHHSKLRLKKEAIDCERKAWLTALEAARDTEQLAETEKKERTARALTALRQGRPDIAARELGEGEASVH
jgi:hypothetical protein